MLSHSAQLDLKRDVGLKQLSQFLNAEAKNLTPDIRNLPIDLTKRAASLWYTNFSSGVVDLAHGGVEDSFFELKVAWSTQTALCRGHRPPAPNSGPAWK